MDSGVPPEFRGEREERERGQPRAGAGPGAVADERGGRVTSPLSEAKTTDALSACVHAAECPGCPLIHLGYRDQLIHKAQHVERAFVPYRELRTLEVNGTFAAPRIAGYRTRAKLVAGDGALGLFKRGTHEVVNIPRCLVLDPLVGAAADALRARLRPDVALHGADIAKVGSALLVTLIADESTTEASLRALAKELEGGVPAIAGIAFTRRRDDAVQLLAGDHVQLSGLSELRDRVADGPHHYVALGAFMQAHADTSAAIYEQLSTRVLEGATSRPRVLELYAGSGALSLALAQRGAELVAVESYQPACDRLARAAREQQLRVEVRCGDASRELRVLAQEGAAFDVALVNPPRRGLDPRVRQDLAQLGAQQVGYVSCKPSTLARDLAHLARLGFHAELARPFDMMPLTEQVETLVWLRRAEPLAPHVVHADGARLIVDKAAHEQLEESSLARLAATYGAPKLKPITSLHAESSGLVALSVNGDASTLEVTTRFVALVRGVVRPRGQLRVGAARVRYARLGVVGGHSLVRAESASDAHVKQAFRVIGHPVVGDARSDRATAKHFAMRHDLDRTFLHASALSIANAGTTFEAKLAPDLLAVLDSLGEGPGSALAQAL